MIEEEFILWGKLLPPTRSGHWGSTSSTFGAHSNEPLPLLPV